MEFKYARLIQRPVDVKILNRISGVASLVVSFLEPVVLWGHAITVLLNSGILEAVNADALFKLAYRGRWGKHPSEDPDGISHIRQRVNEMLESGKLVKHIGLVCDRTQDGDVEPRVWFKRYVARHRGEVSMHATVRPVKHPNPFSGKGGDSAYRKKKRHERIPSAPVAPISSYLWFSRLHARKARGHKDDGTLGAKRQSSASAVWQSLCDADKDEFRNIAALDKARHDEEKGHWLVNGRRKWVSQMKPETVARLTMLVFLTESWSSPEVKKIINHAANSHRVQETRLLR